MHERDRLRKSERGGGGMSYYQRHRRDLNQSDVFKAIQRAGGYVMDTSQTDLGFDGLVAIHGILRPVEVKRDGVFELTPNELRAHRELKAHGITVEILTGVDQSLEVLFRAKTREYYKP